MSTTKAKKPTPKTVVPTFKYKKEQSAFYIDYHKGVPEDLLEVKVTARISEEFNMRDAVGKISGPATVFSYDIESAKGKREGVPEDSLYPNITEASKAFAEHFLTLLLK